MQNLQELGKRIAELVQLLSEMAELEITAEIRLDEGVTGCNKPGILVRLAGRDTPMLTADNGRVLDAIESLSLDMLGLVGPQRELVRFDAGSFLADQTARLRQVARAAVEQVTATGTPHVFPPMSFRERTMLKDALLPSGLSYETLGQNSAQWVILFPKGMRAPLEGPESQHPSCN